METLFPCRTCENQKDFNQVTEYGCTFKCAKGHPSRALKVYGADTQEQGEIICSDYAHEEDAWF
jgi:hypothetical protein